MIFTSICRDKEPDEITIFGKLEDFDWNYHNTDCIADLDRIVFQDSIDFTIKFLRGYGDPIIVSISKSCMSFFIAYQNTYYIDISCMRMFIQETINRYVELEKEKLNL